MPVTPRQHPIANQHVRDGAERQNTCAGPRACSHPLASTVLPRFLWRPVSGSRGVRKTLSCWKDLVAGTGFEPVTFRL